MRYTTLGHSDLEVSAVCLGTMTFGQQNSEAEAHAQLDYARERGINFIDTAELYPAPPRPETCHRTESIVGNWLRQQRREDVVLATKVTGGGRGIDWIRGGELAFDRQNIRTAVEASLNRLQTDYIDLYQLHWPERNTPMFGEYRFDPIRERPFTPVRETLEVMGELVEEGKIRHLGLSNEWPWGVMQFLLAARDHGLPRVVSIQNAYNLIHRTYETALLEFAYREGLSLLAYSPLAFGLLSAKYLQDPTARGRVTLFDGFAQRYLKPNMEPAVAAYAELAQRHGMTPAQFALAFVYSRWFAGAAIIGATSITQLQENIDAYDLELPPEAEAELEQIHLRFFNPAP